MCRSATAGSGPTGPAIQQETIHHDSTRRGDRPHQDSITLGVVDEHGVEITWETFPNSAAGFFAVVDLLTTNRVNQVGIEGSAGWGAHVALALTTAGFDTREVPAQRSAQERRSRRHDKTDNIDVI